MPNLSMKNIARKRRTSDSGSYFNCNRRRTSASFYSGRRIRHHIRWLFCIKRTSEKVAVVGAGYIAVELAGVLQQLGSETYLFVRKHAPLRNFDPLLTDTLTEIIEQSDMTLHKHAVPQKVEKNPDGSLTLSLEDGRTETVDTLIWAIGRKPVIQGLQIEKAGVELLESGHIAVDKFQNTNVAGIYAVGDVTGHYELTPVAIAAGRRLSERLFNNKKMHI